jgi:hypothetical protein
MIASRKRHRAIARTRRRVISTSPYSDKSWREDRAATYPQKLNLNIVAVANPLPFSDEPILSHTVKGG